MVLKLKKVFQDESETIHLATTVDLSNTEFHGTKPFVQPVRVDVKVFSRAGMIFMNLAAHFCCCFVCDRCACEFERDFDRKYEHILVLQLSDESGDDYIEVPEYQIELDRIVREDIILDLPSKLLCGDDCKGLCPICGRNLNEGDCGCLRAEADPRLAALSEFFSG